VKVPGLTTGAGVGPRQNSAYGNAKGVRPALGGELAARDPVWDGEGWGVTGSRVSVFSRY